MSETVICLDTGVVIKTFIEEDQPDLHVAARRLMLRALNGGFLIAPAFAWAEVGSVLRKKIRQGMLRPDQAQALWDQFNKLPIEYFDTQAIRTRAWELADRYTLPTLYDAAFLACTEAAPVSHVTSREFWTTDQALLRSLAPEMPLYVRPLSTVVSSNATTFVGFGGEGGDENTRCVDDPLSTETLGRCEAGEDRQ
jgi:predicted nucleic acid-binding protein